MDQNYLMNEWEIARTIDELAFDLDSKKLDKAVETFTEDAKLTIVEDGKTVLEAAGKEQITENISARMANIDYMLHNNGTRVFDVKSLDQAAEANTSCICKMATISPKADIMQFMEYYDQLIKVNGYWYIVSRTIRILSKSVK